MKKIILILFLSIAIHGAAHSQSQTKIESPNTRTVVFWTDDPNSLDIRINVNGSYAGDITRAYNSVSGVTVGCVSTRVSSGRNNIVRAFYPNGTERFWNIPVSTANLQTIFIPGQANNSTTRSSNGENDYSGGNWSSRSGGYDTRTYASIGEMIKVQLAEAAVDVSVNLLTNWILGNYKPSPAELQAQRAREEAYRRQVRSEAIVVQSQLKGPTTNSLTLKNPRVVSRSPHINNISTSTASNNAKQWSQANKTNPSLYGDYKFKSAAKQFTVNYAADKSVAIAQRSTAINLGTRVYRPPFGLTTLVNSTDDDYLNTILDYAKNNTYSIETTDLWKANMATLGKYEDDVR